MNILHFSTADNEGGSARSAYRIHQGLKKLSQVSRMLVGKKVTQDEDIDTVSGAGIGRIADFLADKVGSFLGYQYWWVPSTGRVLGHPWLKEANIIQLFNTHGGYFSINLLPELCRRAPVVWRLSDMWPATAHSAYTYGCECYIKGPEACVCKPSNYPPIGRNAVKQLWQKKEEIYKQCNFTIVAPSSWIEERAKESLLLKRFPIVRIPNGIDTAVFSQKNKMESRKQFDIPQNARVILFVAHGLDNNPRKGGEYLIDALGRLGSLENAILLLAGEGGQSFTERVKIPVHRLGFVKSETDLAAVYSAADLMVVPSEVENLPNNLLEAAACGLPSVAFDTGGIKDFVRHGETGWLVPHGDSGALSLGIATLLGDQALRERLGAAAAQVVRIEFSQEKEAKSFLALYERLAKRE